MLQVATIAVSDGSLFILRVWLTTCTFDCLDEYFPTHQVWCDTISIPFDSGAYNQLQLTLTTQLTQSITSWLRESYFGMIDSYYWDFSDI